MAEYRPGAAGASAAPSGAAGASFCSSAIA